MANGNPTTALATVETAENGLSVAAESAIDQERQRFELAQRKAKIYSESSLVPKEYQHNIGNVLIAENMAHRMGADTLMVMQNLYIVHGKPAWSAAFLIACFNSCGRFSAIKYHFSGEGDEYGCHAYCTEIATGDHIEGPKVTLGMAKKEGWYGKNGSKWQTIPDLMFRYRAGTFLVRTTAPEIGMGLQTREEIEDIGPGNGISAPAAQGINGVRNRLGIDQPVADITTEPIEDEPPTTDEQILEQAEADAESSAEVAAPEPPIDELADLRNHVKDELDALPKNRQKDLLAGKEAISKMDRDQLTQLETEIGKAQDS